MAPCEVCGRRPVQEPAPALSSATPDLNRCFDCDCDFHTECADCGGEGFVDIARFGVVRGYFTEREPCETCNPSGELDDETGRESGRDGRDVLELLFVDAGTEG